MLVPFARSTALLLLASPLLAQLSPTKDPRTLPGPAGRSLPEPCGNGGSLAELPPGFTDVAVSSDWEQPVGLVFDAGGRMYVWDKGGRVWIVQDGYKLPWPLIDLSEEVGNWESHGLKGFALDPDFLNNGYLYLFYCVDKHHLLYAGTPLYDPAEDQFWENTIGRLVRYTANAADGFLTVDPESRKVLLGETASDGLPICGIHGCGTLLFFEDGSLAVSTGEGNNNGYGSSSCVADGILAPKEEIANHRAQLLDSLSGKVLRLDPATGAGLPGNPWFNPALPMATPSRVWALGLRNPFRMTLRPGSAGLGTLFIGDVGGFVWEELNVCRGGENFGWPLWQGLAPELDTLAAPVANLDAPNPLFGLLECQQPFFYFQDLVVEDSLHPASWPNPCLPKIQVQDPVPTFVHARPALAWKHFADLALVPTFDAQGDAATEPLGSPASPVAGEPFPGNCSIGGAWYTGGSYPAQYHGTYFHADHGEQWIKNLIFDAADNLLEVRNFAPTVGAVVDLTVHPLTGDLYYVDVYAPGDFSVRRISYSTDNLPPEAVISASPLYGPAPLTVQLDAGGSTDPEGRALSFEWTFSDGTPSSSQAALSHAFPTQDVSPSSELIARLFELDPPAPMGFGNPDAELLRDGFYPPLASVVSYLQFDTTHVDPLTAKPDKGPLDWLGYELSGARELRGLVFQEGFRYPGQEGGWFETIDVQVRGAGTGVWTPVTGLAFAPPYPTSFAGGPSFETYEIRFDPVVGDGVRVIGAPGGTFEFVGSAELRALATGSVAVPRNYTATLLVTDDFGNVDCASVTVSVNNSPPAVQVLSPVHGSAVDVSDIVTLPYEAVSSDAEHATSELSCVWQTTLVHDNHFHPEPPDTSCSTSGTFVGHGSDPGDVLYWTIELTVSDPLGLATTETVGLYFADDCNFNGVSDALEIAAGTSLDLNDNGRPDECETDCNANGVHDLFDLVFGTSADADEDGVPDECQ
ncbi:MAG: PQQ-dependent sugar dehydrogenase [Planctomycetota bacterium]